ncbi:hypothetical protein CBS9595_002649 [Malassezia furfur]|nr:hypothetical protein CBS9595_002649 [Malassezia furfur]
MADEVPLSGADAVPALEAKASQDLQAAREIHARQPRKSSAKKHSYYWNEPVNSVPAPTTPSVYVHASMNPPSGSMHSRTTSNSFTSWKTNDTVLTGQTTPQQIPTMSSPLTQIRMAQAERPSMLDVSALSPQEYVQFGRWVERIKPAHTRRRGLLDEHAAVKFLRNEFGITVDDEVKIMSLFERLPLGLTPGHFFAMLRLASWAQQGRMIDKDLIFLQTRPPESRRRRPHHSSSRVSSTATDVPKPATRSSPPLLPQPMLMDIPRAPPRQLPDDEARMDQASETRSSPKVVRPKPVLARPTTLPPPPGTLERHPSVSGTITGADDAETLHQPSRASLRAPDSPHLLTTRPSFDRPSAPQPQTLPQVSPLIQASLNARSEMKKASRQALRPKTFTVLSSSSGQVERDKPRLLTGQEAPPQAHSKRRTHSINKMSSFLAQEARPNNGDAADMSGVQYAGLGPTIAPTPSYLGRHHGILPAWLREQQEEGNVAYAPPDDLSTPSVFEALDEKVHESMNGSERAAASINRNTPFFPPHKRDLDRVAQADLDGSAPAHYRALNAQTSAASDAGGTRMKLSTSRSKSMINASKTAASMPRRRVDPAWGTLLESGTYAGFKSTPSARDLRLLTPRKELGSKRSAQLAMPPSQEFQPMRTPAPSSALPPSPGPVGDESHGGEERERERDEPPEPLVRPGHVPATLRAEAVWTPKMQPNPRPTEMQRFVLQGDATRPQLPHGDTTGRPPFANTPSHDRKLSGSYGTEFKSWSRPEPVISELGADHAPASGPAPGALETPAEPEAPLEPETRVPPIAEGPVPAPDPPTEDALPERPGTPPPDVAAPPSPPPPIP